MGLDRGVLPTERDRDETYPWMGLVAILVIVGGLLLIVIWAAAWIADPEPTVTSHANSRVAIIEVL